MESDLEIDEDIRVNTHIPPPNVLSDSESSGSTESNVVVKWISVLLSIFESRFFVTNRAMTWLVKFIGILLCFLGRYSTHIALIASKFPSKLRHFNRSIETDCQFERRVACTKCNSIYELKDCLDKIGSVITGKTCTFKPFSKCCNASLMKEIVTCNGSKRFYPHRVYCFSNLVSDLQALVRRPGFVEQCESTRSAVAGLGLLSDVYDGSIWKDFVSIDDTPFLSQCNNYGLLLNIDWLQPFDHITYSVGVIYLVILNLPRSIRFKQDNVILYGIIPGPSEPSLTINTYLAPLVSELLKLWKGVELSIPGSDGEVIFRCALLGVACDLPAARKVSGFLSYSANLGCSRCYQEFSRGFGIRNYDNFERGQWRLRSNERHRLDIQKILRCTTKAQKVDSESKYGCRYSVLLELPYYRPVEMTLIDPMHNLFLGTAKHFARVIWIGKNVLDSQNIAIIESRLKNATVPSGLGRIPVSINAGVFLTAEQWKNWTLYFSLYCLKDLLSTRELECWRDFVLACRKLCNLSISSDDVKVADVLLLRFCKRASQLYGSEVITPNMHMHCHLATCIMEFGPIHSFWLFPFERYNGILEGQPTNNRSVETQLLRRFRKDIRHLNLYREVKDMPYADIFKPALPDSLCDDSFMKFDTTVVPGPRALVAVLSLNELRRLRKFYSQLYPQLAIKFLTEEIPISSTYKKYCSVRWKGKNIVSTMSSTKNPYVYAKPPFPFQTSGFNAVRLTEIQFFVLHTIKFPGNEEAVNHLLACGNWPMVHPNRNYYGKPVEVLCRSLYESNADNTFFLATSIEARAIVFVDEVIGEKVLTSVSIVE